MYYGCISSSLVRSTIKHYATMRYTNATHWMIMLNDDRPMHLFPERDSTRIRIHIQVVVWLQCQATNELSGTIWYRTFSGQGDIGRRVHEEVFARHHYWEQLACDHGNILALHGNLLSTLSRCDENPTPKDRAMSCNDQNDCYRHARPQLCRNRNKYRKCLTLTMTETIFSDAISPILRHTLLPPQLLDGVVGQDEKLKRQSIMPSHDGRMDGAWAMRTWLIFLMRFLSTLPRFLSLSRDTTLLRSQQPNSHWCRVYERPLRSGISGDITFKKRCNRSS